MAQCGRRPLLIEESDVPKGTSPQLVMSKPTNSSTFGQPFIVSIAPLSVGVPTRGIECAMRHWGWSSSKPPFEAWAVLDRRAKSNPGRPPFFRSPYRGLWNRRFPSPSRLDGPQSALGSAFSPPWGWADSDRSHAIPCMR